MTNLNRPKPTFDLKVGDTVTIAEPVSGEDHEGDYHELPAYQIGVIERIELLSAPQFWAYTVSIPVDEERSIVNVWDEADEKHILAYLIPFGLQEA